MDLELWQIKDLRDDFAEVWQIKDLDVSQTEVPTGGRVEFGRQTWSNRTQLINN
jgi:hypothetical protein